MLSMTSNERGKAFEDIVEDLLNCLQQQNPGDTKTTPGAVKVKKQVRIELHDSVIVKPDFELICRLDHIRDCHLIECQDRYRSSQEIVHKIRHIKSLSDKNKFIFVYKNEDFLTEAVRKALDNDGILHYSLDEFVIFLLKLNTTMAKLSARPASGEFEYFKARLKLIILTDSLKLDQIKIEKKPVSDGAMLTSVPRTPDRFNF